jgi:glycine/D-amino acid oxidase-like deaminating enzyme
MPVVDAVVLGAGIVGTSTALQLVKRGLAVALIDRRGPGEETSYGNAGMIGRAPGHSGLWLAYGHAHWGLTLGPTTGGLIADMMTGAAPFADPAPYRAERFLQ